MVETATKYSFIMVHILCNFIKSTQDYNIMVETATKYSFIMVHIL